jgi:hypothetical protein
MDELIAKRLAISNMYNKNHLCLIIDSKDNLNMKNDGDIKGLQGKDRYRL